MQLILKVELHLTYHRYSLCDMTGVEYIKPFCTPLEDITAIERRRRIMQEQLLAEAAIKLQYGHDWDEKEPQRQSAFISGLWQTKYSRIALK